MIWRLVLVGAFALLAQTATAAGYVNEAGDTLTYVDHADYDFTVDRGGVLTWCFVSRAPDQTTGVCDDGTEGAMFRKTLPNGTDTVSFAGGVWFRTCEHDGYTLNGELGAEY